MIDNALGRKITDKRLQLLNNFGMKGLNDIYKIYNKRKIFFVKYLDYNNKQRIN